MSMSIRYGIIDPKTGEPPSNLRPGNYPLVLTAVTLVVPSDTHHSPYMVVIAELLDETNMTQEEEGPNSNGSAHR